MKKMLRASLAALAVLAAVQTSDAFPSPPPPQVFCMCACPNGGTILLMDDSFDCNICHYAAYHCPNAES